MISLFLKLMINVMQIINSFYKSVVGFIQEKIEMRGIEFIKLEHSDRLNIKGYDFKSCSSDEMGVLSYFLTSECCTDYLTEGYKEGILDEHWYGCAGNMVMIDKQDGYIYLSYLYPEEGDEYLEIKISIDQLLKIMDEWQIIINLEKNHKHVILKRKDDHFTFETYD